MILNFNLRTPDANYLNRWYRNVGKGFIDRCASVVMLVLLLPVMVMIGVAIRALLGHGVFFVQSRAGLHGKPFLCYKYRTMDYDRRKNNSNNFITDLRSGIPSARDPRHSSFGLLLRRYGLDELPQLLNVLRGEMGIVGPRPEIAEISLHYNEKERQRFSVKPGMTGYWQVTCRSSAIDLRTHVDMDIEYANKISIMNDIRIILRTPYAMLYLPAVTDYQRRT